MATMNTKQAPERLAYSLDDAAHAAGISRAGLCRFIAAGAVPCRQLGGKRVILADDLRAWLHALPEGGDAA